MSQTRQSSRRLSLVETFAACFVSVVLAIIGTAVFIGHRFEPYVMSLDPLAAELEKRYGPSKSSQYNEEWIIRDYLKDRREGVFLDVGANHYKKDSNTYYLETTLGWSGIAVDALEEFAADYKAHRPRTRYVAMFASDTVNEKVHFFVGENPLVSSSDPAFTQRYGAEGKPRDVPTTTLNVVLDQGGVRHLDFMSMDIELAEPKALAGFEIERFQPELVCIEAHPEVRQQILDYFVAHGYVVVGRYLRTDPYNLYFAKLRGPAF
jgi:hypothetical protein